MCAQCRSSITFAIWNGDDGWWKFEDVINSETQQQVSLTFSYKCNTTTLLFFLSSMTNVYWLLSRNSMISSSENLDIFTIEFSMLLHIRLWLAAEYCKKRDLFSLDSFFLSLLSLLTHKHSRAPYIVLYEYKKSDIHSPTRSLAHFFYCIKMQIYECVREREKKKKKAELVLSANFAFSLFV